MSYSTIIGKRLGDWQVEGITSSPDDILESNFQPMYWRLFNPKISVSIGRFASYKDARSYLPKAKQMWQGITRPDEKVALILASLTPPLPSKYN